jgi:hypothetical protein
LATPAFWYPTLSANWSAASHRSVFCCSIKYGAGARSIFFWLRRWTDQSR